EIQATERRRNDGLDPQRDEHPDGLLPGRTNAEIRPRHQDVAGANRLSQAGMVVFQGVLGDLAEFLLHVGAGSQGIRIDIRADAPYFMQRHPGLLPVWYEGRRRARSRPRQPRYMARPGIRWCPATPSVP